jgi:triosephosphate isomerase
MSFLVVANFKSNKTTSEVKSWISAVQPTSSVVVAPSFVHLNLFDKSFILAGQDVSPFPPGSYTGAIAARELKGQGVTYCIVGHSERRTYFHETSVEIASKVKELLTVGITPIVCVRKEDLSGQRGALDDALIKDCYFCYEPPEDIGGTVTAPLTDIKSTTGQIAEIFDTKQVMYGGSVNAENINSLLPLGIQGVIVATASLDSASFNQILAKISHAKI